MRKLMVDQKNGEEHLTVKVHMDDMKRVTVREQEYFFHNISNTPFSLGIVFPGQYGRYRVRGGLEVNQAGRIDGESEKLKLLLLSGPALYHLDCYRTNTPSQPAWHIISYVLLLSEIFWSVECI